MTKHIVSGSAGYIEQEGLVRFGPIMSYALKLTKKTVPKICYIGTAGGDSPGFIRNFYNASLSEKVQPSHLEFFLMPNVHDVRKFILSQDMIWVGGGSVANLLAIWRTHGLDEVLREAWEKGIVLSGVSAGSICWHQGGTTDSFGTELRPVTNGLGFLPYSNGVHYDSEARRRPLFQKLIADGVLADGYATDDGVAIHYIDTRVHAAITATSGKYAYHVVKTANGVKETKIAPKLVK